MKIVVPPGRYVVAVSGGVDSVVLLHLLIQEQAKIENRKSKDTGTKAFDAKNFGFRPLQLTVAHYDHGIRTDSKLDRLFVQKLAEEYGLAFEYGEGHLGERVSEDAARRARYLFLRKIKSSARAAAIITAHHLDDVLETAVINLLRGTGRRGLSSLKNTPEILRPLLGASKHDILAYARRHSLKWREDSTNQDERYLRNYVRRKIISRFSPAERQMFLSHLEDLSALNHEIDAALTSQLQISTSPHHLDRRWFIMLPHQVARDVMAGWLRASHGTFDKKLIEKLVTSAKTLQPGKIIDVDNTYKVVVEKEKLALVSRER